jgi:hypothetical protein
MISEQQPVEDEASGLRAFGAARETPAIPFILAIP